MHLRKKMSSKLIGNKRTLGLKRSDEQKISISNRMKGKTAWNKGVNWAASAIKNQDRIDKQEYLKTFNL